MTESELSEVFGKMFGGQVDVESLIRPPKQPIVDNDPKKQKLAIMRCISGLKQYQLLAVVESDNLQTKLQQFDDHSTITIWEYTGRPVFQIVQ